MPQVHKKKSMGLDSFSKVSPFLAAYNFSEQSKRRVKAINGLDKRMCNVKLKFFEKESLVNTRKIERVKARIVDNLHKRLAYKYVLRKHPVAHASDYPNNLDEKYTYQAMQHEVKDMINYMKPTHARKRRAEAQIEANKKRYDQVIRENNKTLDKLCPPKPRWQAVDFSKFGKQEEEEEQKTPSPELTAHEKRQKQGLAGMRRRIIALDESKPSSPAKTPAMSPSKAPPLSKPPSTNSMIGAGRRQGITMSMMKKQQSFLSNKEKTETLDTVGTGAIVKPTEEAKPDIDTSRSVKTDRRKSIDQNNKDLSGSVSERLPNRTAQKANTQRRKSTGQNSIDVSGSVSERTAEKPSKNSLLPPINQHARQSPGISGKDIMMSPTLTTGAGSPVKLPVLKMASNNARKEIKVS